MKSRILWLASALALFTTVRAQAQHRTTTTIGFETDCTGATLNNNLSILGYRDIRPDLFAPCGLALISTTASAGGSPQVHKPLSAQAIPGRDGDFVLAGATDTGLTTGPITLTFSPPVNEVSMRVLDMANASGLRVRLYNGATLLSDTSPMANAQGRVDYSYVTPSASPIVPVERVELTYAVAGFIDTWYVDVLRFNAWSCGDGETEAGAGENCDDTNAVQCDGCDNSCRTSVVGCLSGTSCIPNGAVPAGSFSCAVCDTSVVVPAGSDKLPRPAPANTACDDGLYCTVSEACNGVGACVGTPRDCADSAACTNDSCNEAADKCDNTLVTDGCVIGGASCVGPNALNPANPCQACQPTQSTTSYTNRAQNTQCGSPACAGGTLTPSPLCDASGQCQTQAPISCNGSACVTPTSCTGTCVNDLQCQLGYYCAPDGTCKPKGDPGDSCTGNAQCTTGFCTDGVCCNTACDGTCEACGLAGKLGVCSPYAPGTDPQMECPAGQFCGGGRSCVIDTKPDGEACTDNKTCASGYCVDGVCCNAACDGTCEACNLVGKPGMCSPYPAGSDPELECPTGQFCGGSRSCVIDVRPRGDDCSENSMCQSGHCVDGVCCDTACDRSCESCGMAGAEGTCTPYTPGTDPELECGEARFCASPGICVAPDLPDGEACSGDAYCKSGHCVDGVCCDVACGGACAACNVKGSVGMCTPYGAGTDPEGECTGGAVCDGIDRCVGFETRGNGLCAVGPARRDESRASYAFGLLGLGLLAVLRKRRKR